MGSCADTDIDPICMGLHEVYSYALSTKSEVKVAGYWPNFVVVFV